VGWGAVLALGAYLLLAPPVLMLAPLAGLLLLSRPGTTREWAWIIGALAWSAVWLSQPAGLALQFARAGAVLLTGTFLALTVWQPSARFSRALGATTIAAAAMILWMWHLDLGWAEVQRALEQNLLTYNRDLMMRLSEAAGTPAGSEGSLSEMSSMVQTVGSLYPAFLVLASLAGLRLAWRWYHRIARRPLGPAPAPFTTFQFHDQLVWGWVAGLSLSLLPLAPGGQQIGGNLLMIWAALYAARGLAVFSVGSGRVSSPVVAAISVVAVFLLPFVLAGLTLLGLADTWLDFRRRLVTTSTT